MSMHISVDLYEEPEELEVLVDKLYVLRNELDEERSETVDEAIEVITQLM